MTEAHVTPSATSNLSAGALLRQYREQQGIDQEALAQLLRVSVAKLQALEGDRWNDLPDAMFARTLTLAVCRHLKVDAKPVLDLLPATEASPLAKHDERGLGYAFDRPSLLPQSPLHTVLAFFSPMRSAAVAVFVLAAALFVFTDSPSTDVGTTVETVTSPLNVSAGAPLEAASEAEAPTEPIQQGQMVVTSVHSAAVAEAASAAAAVQATPGASDAR